MVLLLVAALICNVLQIIVLTRLREQLVLIKRELDRSQSSIRAIKLLIGLGAERVLDRKKRSEEHTSELQSH